MLPFARVFGRLVEFAFVVLSNWCDFVQVGRLQGGILLGMGLQRTTVESLAAHFNLAVNQASRWCLPLHDSNER